MTELFIAFFIWAIVHSITASRRTKAFVKKVISRRAYEGVYRMVYNLFSIVTLIPVLYYLSQSVPTMTIWSISTPYRYINYAIQFIAALGLGISVYQTNIWSFAGVAQFVRYLRGEAYPELPPQFVSSGTYNLVRHPLYFFSLLLLWANPDMTLSLLVLNIWVTIYFIAGSFNEERRLLDEFGDEYRQYRERVPRLLPFRWPSPPV